VGHRITQSWSSDDPRSVDPNVGVFQYVGRLKSETHDRTREVVLDELGRPRGARERWVVRREMESDPELPLRILAACRTPSRPPRSWFTRVLTRLFVTVAGSLSGLVGVALGAVELGALGGLAVGCVAALVGGWVARVWLEEGW
jgi:hypothetical protein